MSETSLAQCVPLWRTLHEAGVTVLVTPALDYVGCLELGGIDVRFVSDATAWGVGEALRGLVGSLEDHVNLLFLYRVYEDGEAEVRAKTVSNAVIEPPPGAMPQRSHSSGNSAKTDGV